MLQNYKQIKIDREGREYNGHLVAPERKAGVVCEAGEKFTSPNLHCKYNSDTK